MAEKSFLGRYPMARVPATSRAVGTLGPDAAAGESALNDNLRANLGGVSGPFSGTNTVNGVGAGGSGNIALGLNTGSAGVFNQNGAVSFLSYNADMADVSAGPADTMALLLLAAAGAALARPRRILVK
jgi:hypothetical protein